MYNRGVSRCYKNLSEMNFEDSENKQIVPIEHFCYEVIKMIDGVKYFYNDMLIGAIDAVSHKRKIKCKESYKEVFSRTRAFLKEDILPLEGQCEAALVVCHGAILRALLSIIGKLPLEEYWNIHQPNCSVNLAQVSGGEITMIKERILYYHAKHMRGGIL